MDIASLPNKSYLVYKCVSGCSHYIRFYESLGRPTICWSCEDPIEISEYHIAHNIMKPKCVSCRKGTKEDEGALEKLMKSIKK